MNDGTLLADHGYIFNINLYKKLKEEMRMGVNHLVHKISIDIVTEWDIILARQIGRKQSREVGFESVDQVRVTTVISELARNIYLYARSGIIEIELIEKNAMKGIAITASDKGPGIENIRKVMEEGYSTSGGLGAGLPGVKRLMDTVYIHSSLGEGTIVRTEKWLRK